MVAQSHSKNAHTYKKGYGIYMHYGAPDIKKDALHRLYTRLAYKEVYCLRIYIYIDVYSNVSNSQRGHLSSENINWPHRR